MLRLSLLLLLISACAPAPLAPTPAPSASGVVSASPSPAPALSLPGAPVDTSALAIARNELALSKAQYKPGESLEVRFAIMPKDKLDAQAWVGLVPTDVPHGKGADNALYRMAYAELGPHHQGTLVFDVPETPGKYDLRMHDRGENGRELIYVTFEVVGEHKPLVGNQMEIDKTVFRPGEEITVRVSIKAEDKRDESAWVGIVPAVIPHGDEKVNDQYNLGYQYLGKYLLGTMRFTAPAVAGEYTFRLHDTDTDGRELAFLPFQVIAAP